MQSLINAINSVGSQVIAMFVLVIGCVMIIVCKRNGIDPTIAGGIVGCAINMLTNMFVKHVDSSSKSINETTIPK